MLKRLLQRPLAFVAEGLHRARRAQRRDHFESIGVLTIGEHTYGHPEILDSGGDRGRVFIGRYSSIANVKILLGGNHHSEWVTTYPVRIKFDLPGKYADGQPYTKGDVVIGSDVWIGEDVLILSGVRIGHGAVVAAGSVCTHDIPEYAIAAGNPVRIIRMRFSEDQIRALLQIAWWNWDHKKVAANVASLCSPDVDAFIRKHLATVSSLDNSST